MGCSDSAMILTVLAVPSEGGEVGGTGQTLLHDDAGFSRILRGTIVNRTKYC